MFAVLLACAVQAPAMPRVLWASDPVAPGQAVLLFGDGLEQVSRIELARLPDDPPGALAAPSFPPGAVPCEPLQPSPCSVKFRLPAGLKPGVFACRLITPEGVSAPVLLNRPTAWWVQGDQGTAGSPGGWLRVQGRCLSLAGSRPRVLLTGPRPLELPAEGDQWSLRIALPAELPPGDWQLRVHHGGGPGAWSGPLTVRIETARRPVGPTLDVRELGAAGDGREDDTAAIRDGLARLAGGGTLYFPRGRYLVSDTLPLPPGLTLRGESRELSLICWPDRDEPLADMLVATRDLTIEDLTFGLGNYGNFLTTSLGKPDSGDIRLRRLRVLGDRYRGHMYQHPDELSRRFTRYGVHGGKLLSLGGRNLEVTDCDLMSSSGCLYLTAARGALIRGNRLRLGRFGWYWLSGSDGVIFEDNLVQGADLSSWGGGINVLDGSPASQHVLFARNTLRWFYGGDHEAVTTDGSGSPYFGRVTAVDGVRLTLADEPEWSKATWRGGSLFVLGGKGLGQERTVTAYEGREVTLDQPLDIPPDATSWVSVSRRQRRLLLIDNEFEEVGVAIQFYGTSVDCIAAGNRVRRGAGFANHGMNYHGYQPSWFTQWLGNTIEEGNSYGNAYVLNQGSALQVTAFPGRGSLSCPLTVATIVRGNKLANNACISLGAGNPPGSNLRCPWLAEVIVEDNQITDNEVGVAIAEGVQGALLSGNRCTGVAQPVLDLAAVAAGRRAKREAVAGRSEPLARWSFDALSAGKVSDLGGHGLDAAPSGALTFEPGVAGQAARFDGQVHLIAGVREQRQDLLNQPNLTIAVWVKPEAVKGRQPLIGKRFRETGVPFILSLLDAKVVFEGSNAAGRYEYNFGSPPVMQAGEWQHLAAVVQSGRAVRLYRNGKLLAEHPVTEPLSENAEPLVFGRDPWGGATPGARGPAWYTGLMDEAAIWARALTPEEIQALARRP